MWYGAENSSRYPGSAYPIRATRSLTGTPAYPTLKSFGCWNRLIRVIIPPWLQPMMPTRSGSIWSYASSMNCRPATTSSTSSPP